MKTCCHKPLKTRHSGPACDNYPKKQKIHGVSPPFLNAAQNISLECVVTINPIDIGGRKGVILLVRDIHGDDATQQKMASQAFLEQQSTSLLFLQEAIDDMGTAPVFCRAETPDS